MNPDLSVLPNELAFSVADKVQKWTYSAWNGEYEINDAPRNTTADRQYETRLDRAITETQTKIESQKRVLEDLRRKSQEEEDKQQTLVQNLNPESKRLHDLATELVRLQATTKSQNYLSHMVSQVPSSDSPLNTLLTRQNVEAMNEQTVDTIRDVKANIADLQSRLNSENALMKETMEISDALKERLASLRTKSQQTSSQYIVELSHQKTKLAAQTRTLTAGVRQFIKDHLAEILAAEHQGSLPGDPTSLPKGKRRRPSDDDEDRPEKELAARMTTLVEELMNRLATPDRMSPWADVLEDDVVVRCLVRANVAIMHPNDGSKIRLVEFHKEMESGDMEDD